MRWSDLVQEFHYIKHLATVKKYRKFNKIEMDSAAIKHVHLHIKGIGNEIHIMNLSVGRKTDIHISICGNFNKVHIDGVSIGDFLRAFIGQDHPYFGKVEKSSIIIGKGTSIGSLRYITYNSNTACTLGKNCMISSGVILWNTDAHPILDLQSGNILNPVKGIHIGDHCWLGEGVSVMKNTDIPEDCILGHRAVVSGHLQKPHSIYAGNPAKFIKSGVTWDPNGASRGYIENSGRQG